MSEWETLKKEEIEDMFVEMLTLIMRFAISLRSIQKNSIVWPFNVWYRLQGYIYFNKTAAESWRFA